MRKSLLLFLGFWVGLATIDSLFGFDAAYDAGYGAISLLAVVISGTFAWLWRIRATPMALGMAFSWAGCAGLVGYWWTFNQVGRPPGPGIEHDLLWGFVALYLAGAGAHLRVITNAHGGGRPLFLLTFGSALAASLALAFAMG